MVEIVHDPFQLTFTHLPVAYSDSRFRYQFRQPLCGFLNIFDVIIQIVNLTAAQDFTQNRFPYYQAIILANKGFYRQTTGRGSGDNGEIAHTAHRHIQRPRDRRRRERQNIDIGAHRLNSLFVAHAETVLFIDNQQAEVVQLHIAL